MPPTDTAAGAALLDRFGRIVIINLPERPDRRAEMARELARIGLALDHPAVQLFPAIRPAATAGFPSIGAHGAFLSHLGVLETILEQGWDRALILEDDVSLGAGFARRLGPVLAQLNGQDWDMVYGHCRLHDLPAPNGLAQVPPDRSVDLLHFLGMKASTARLAVPYLRAMLARPTGSAEGGPMHVDGAYNWFRRSHPQLRVFAACPPLAVQRPSPSDIAASRWHHRLPGLRALSRLWHGAR
ncbi:MAG: Glycosyltransferase involved in LPS biosynthesis [Rhodobacteraceae bacterium HLUCCA12]|nr:MAG: Glycosyltransferase involved in LPS biosynthesis [Rhodobacteraceae bacterium HLUCCA12]